MHQCFHIHYSFRSQLSVLLLSLQNNQPILYKKCLQYNSECVIVSFLYVLTNAEKYISLMNVIS